MSETSPPGGAEAPDLLLLDPGSKVPASWDALARRARDLSRAVGRRVRPVSFMFSDLTAPPGAPPRVLADLLRERLAAGRRRFLVLPHFLGPSRALTRGVPGVAAELRACAPGLEVEVAPPLVAGEPGDELLVGALAEQVLETAATAGLRRPPVILVDHGSPEPAVTAVRDRVAARLGEVLGPRVRGVSPASMERRPGPEYAFADPLLADALRHLPGRGDVVLALLFLGPGRHAGPGGDIDRIVAGARDGAPDLRVHRTPLVGEHPALTRLLARRLHRALGGCPPLSPSAPPGPGARPRAGSRPPTPRSGRAGSPGW